MRVTDDGAAAATHTGDKQLRNGLCQRGAFVTTRVAPTVEAAPAGTCGSWTLEGSSPTQVPDVEHDTALSAVLGSVQRFPPSFVAAPLDVMHDSAEMHASDGGTVGTTCADTLSHERPPLVEM